MFLKLCFFSSWPQGEEKNASQIPNSQRSTWWTGLVRVPTTATRQARRGQEPPPFSARGKRPEPRGHSARRQQHPHTHPCNHTARHETVCAPRDDATSTLQTPELQQLQHWERELGPIAVISLCFPFAGHWTICDSDRRHLSYLPPNATHIQKRKHRRPRNEPDLRRFLAINSFC